jgi:glyceraldehyde 3-phosphate dehydrogenase
VVAVPTYHGPATTPGSIAEDEQKDEGIEVHVANIAINGLGRIGRAALKILLDTDGLEVVAVNDLISTDNLAYLLRYDTVYGPYPKNIDPSEEAIVIDGQSIRAFGETDPANLPWSELGVDLVLECTGALRRQEDLERHIDAGARFVILSAPAKTESIATVVPGVNGPKSAEPWIISCASCTTNCIAPLVEVMHRRIGIERAIMTTVHAYTSSQRMVDGPAKSFTRGRAGAANLVPTSTGAAQATTKAVPELVGRFDGVAIRAPVAIGSIADVVFVAERPTTREEVVDIFREEGSSDRYRGVLGVSEDPLVSSDIIGDPRASVVDLQMTRVVDGTLVKVMSWYDNEWGFTHQMIRQAEQMLGIRIST